jgi:hypothetical protein
MKDEQKPFDTVLKIRALLKLRADEGSRSAVNRLLRYGRCFITAATAP